MCLSNRKYGESLVLTFYLKDYKKKGTYAYPFNKKEESCGLPAEGQASSRGSNVCCFNAMSFKERGERSVIMARTHEKDGHRTRIGVWKQDEGGKKILE